MNNSGDEDNGDNSGSSAPIDRRKEEYNIALRFMNAIQRKMEQIQMRQRQEASSGGTRMSGFELGEAERKKLYEINNKGLLEGTVAGVLSFILLRRIRSGFMRPRMHQPHPPAAATPGATPHHHAPKSPFQQVKPPSTTNGTPPSQPPPGLEAPSVSQLAQGMHQQQRTGSSTGEKIFRFFSFSLDAIVSFYVAVFVSVRNPGEIMKSMADLPLLEGRSRVSDEFCPEFLHELQAIQKDEALGQSDAFRHPSTPPLQALLKFCHNCRERAAYEQQLRQQLGLPPDAPVSIPPPGVPNMGTSSSSDDADLLSGWKDDTEDNGGDQHDPTDFYDPSQETRRSDGNDWADPFVTDQEEQAKKDRDGRRQGK